MLDDYEEGTWSPSFAATGLSVTHDISNGYYTKIGNHVFFSMLIGTNAVSGTSSYHLTITGLPYTALVMLYLCHLVVLDYHINLLIMKTV